MSEPVNFYELIPQVVLESLDNEGFHTTGRILQLNSYENRVFEIEVENKDDATLSKVVAKFYRPGRWSRASVEEEHRFLSELKEAGLKTFPALTLKNGTTLGQTTEGILWSVFPKIQGRLPQEFLQGDLKKVGLQLATLHNTGARRPATTRLTLGTEHFGDPALEVIEKFIAPEMKRRYVDAAESILDRIDEVLPEFKPIRIHGDCHRGNLLNDGNTFFFVDFDDFCNGPEVQDFWMLTGGDAEEEAINQELLLEGYLQLREFDRTQFELIPLLKGLRTIHYSGWIGRRWQDPSFPKLFPDYREYSYWAEETESLEKLAWNLPV
jgi:Ser/Thr protein kinase RdoA (MazF antagonist)